MLTQRHRPLVYAAATVIGIWAMAMAGYRLALSYQVTAEKVRAYEESVDFALLTGSARDKAMAKLEAMLNALTLEERNRVRNEIMLTWFAKMTEEEKGRFLEATLPTNIKQSLNAFENLPPEKRKKTIDTALRNMRDQESRLEAGETRTNRFGTNRPPISPELEDKIKSIGLNSYYSQSSAETKAELAPVLEEMQNVMELNRRYNNNNNPQ